MAVKYHPAYSLVDIKTRRAEVANRNKIKREILYSTRESERKSKKKLGFG
jgi:hypothetical protein